ncbi:MAG: hypothetical protein KAU62_07795 [Candidatus Heimdallarchaeota archaeon]|nr:hypothetical protein [Candidatus Heimdallarchaeota archaeon]MCK4611042.1 hypothetical protein [Candidatus Heimdallarchaeota archaeon]
MKTKRKTKTILFSSMLICLFMVSLTTQAAAEPPRMSLVYEDRMETQELPIKVVVNFEWDTDSWQKLSYVYLDWDNDKDITAGLYRVEKTFQIDYSAKRPTELALTIPAEGSKYENGSVYFKIIYCWNKCGSIIDNIEEPVEIHEVEIYYEGGIADEEEDDLILYIILGSVAAVVLIALAVMFTIRRRR